MLTFPGYSFIRTSICVGVEPLLPTLPFKAISNFNAIVTTTKNQQNEKKIYDLLPAKYASVQKYAKNRSREAGTVNA